MMDQETMMTMMMEESVSVVIPFQNITTNINIPQGGIGTTFVINIAVSLIYISVFLLCCQRLTLFNVNKKRKLLKAYEQSKLDTTREGIEQLESSSYASTSAPYQNRTPVYYSDDESTTRSESDFDQSEIVSGNNNSTGGGLFHSVKHIFLFLYGTTVTLIPFTPSYKRDFQAVLKTYGRDVATYYRFIQLMIFICLIVTFVCLSILLPIHVTGDLPIYEYDNQFGAYNMTEEDSSLLRTSVIMVVTSPGKLYIHLFIMFVFTAVILLLLYNFITSDQIAQQHYLRKAVTMHSVSSRPLISPLTVKIENLPKSLTSKHDFDQIVEHLFNNDMPLGDSSSKIAKTVLVLDIKYRLDLQKKLDWIKQELEHYVYVSRSPSLLKAAQSKAIVLPDFFDLKEIEERPMFLQPVDAVQYFSRAKEETERRIADWEEKYGAALRATAKENITKQGRVELVVDNMNERSFRPFKRDDSVYASGIGYIVFKTPQLANECLEKYGANGLKLHHNQPVIHVRTGSSTNQGTSNQSSYHERDYHLKLKKVTYEPADINWDIICRMNDITDIKYEHKVKNVMIHIGLVLFLFFFSTPISLWSALQSIFNVGVIKIAVEDVRKLTGPLGNVVFQFLPTLFMFFLTKAFSKVIGVATRWQSYASKSEYKRVLLMRKFLYFVLSTLVLPAFLLSSLDGIVSYFKDEYQLQNALAKIFLPASGAFFINYVLQNAILKNTEDLIRTEDALWYLWKTKFNLYRKPLTPSEKLKVAELSDFAFATEYARVLSIVALALAFSIFSPIITICATLYLVIKYYVDRYQMEYLYSHRIELKNFYADESEETNTVFDSDFLAHLKMVNMLAKLVMVVLILFVTVVTLFFVIRVKNLHFLPHTIFSIGLLICMGICIVYFNLRRRGLSLLENAKTVIANFEDSEDTSHSSRIVLKEAYEYQYSYSFLDSKLYSPSTPNPIYSEEEIISVV